MNELEKIVKFLNDESAKAVKGSEFGLDEHYFGIAAEMIEEYEARLKTLQSHIKAEEFSARIDIVPEVSIALFGDTRPRKRQDGKWVLLT